MSTSKRVWRANANNVLILIILEVTLWGPIKKSTKWMIFHCLNPYYTGSYSMRQAKISLIRISWNSLNPYYTGSYSMSSQDFDQQLKCINGLNPYYTGSYSMRNLRFGITKKVSHVLILIILEVTLWVDAIVKLDISQIES